jgi:hypothetical protein
LPPTGGAAVRFGVNMPSVQPPPLPAYLTGWRSSPKLTDHADKPIPPDWDFFVQPPPEIGQISSAYTSLLTSQNARNAASRWSIALGVAATIELIICFFFYNQTPPPPSLIGPLVMGFVPAMIGLLVVMWFTRFRKTCSYVGVQGVARYKLNGDRNSVPTGDLFVFPAATELRTRQIRRFVNGVYSGTSYNYTWTNANGQKVFNIAGQYHSKASTPKPSDAYWFAVSADVAWSTYLLDQAEEALRHQGFLQFNLNKDRWVRVGSGYFEFYLKGEQEKVLTSEIKSVSLAQGHFSIVGKDAKRFSSKSKYGFDYANMANPKLFMFAMRKLCGYSFN